MPMSTPIVDSSITAIADPSPFETAVRERSWAWLVEFERRLGSDVEIVDAKGARLLQRGAPSTGRGAAALLESSAPPLMAALSAACATRTPHVVTLDGLEVVCTALVHDTRVAGALVVSRPLTVGRGEGPAAVSIDLVASWLSTAAEAHLTDPPGLTPSGLDRVSPLCRLLAREARAGSDAGLVRWFAEAMAIWYDIDVSGYVETDAGTFVRDVVLPGNAGDRSPASIPAEGVPTGTDLVRWPQEQGDRLGSGVASEAWATRVRAGSGPAWLLLMAGKVDAHGAHRLAAAVAVLRLSMQVAAAAAAAGIAAAVSRALAGAHGPDGTRLALDTIRTTVGATTASLVIESPDGTPLVRPVHMPDGAARESPDAARIVVTRASLDRTITLTLTRHDGRAFTPIHRQAAQAASLLLDACAGRATPRTGGGERRRVVGRPESEIEQYAAQTLTGGVPVTVLVLTLPPTAREAEAQLWVRSMRAWLRDSDVVDVLAPGEIGVLLRHTAREDAAGIVGRLKEQIENVRAETGPLTVGAASRTPGDAAAGIVQDARKSILLTTRGKSPAEGF
jgi:hypothetical protein